MHTYQRLGHGTNTQLDTDAKVPLRAISIQPALCNLLRCPLMLHMGQSEKWVCTAYSLSPANLIF